MIVCSDLRVSSALGTAETHVKQHSLPQGWCCMGSGDSVGITSLEYFVYSELSHLTEIDETNIVPTVSLAMQKRKSELAQQYVGVKFGIDYESFLKFGKERFNNEIFRNALLDIAGIPIRASLLICGFYKTSPLICVTTTSGAVSIIDHFGVIGEGAPLANSVLLHRSHDETKLLSESIYSVFEAKKYAERVSSVGENTNIRIMDANGTMRSVGKEGITWLQARFEEFGPKHIKRMPTFDESFLVDDVRPA
jgi:hypothetical protein